MNTLLLDTNIVSYQMRGHTLAAAYAPLLAGNTLAISFMTVAELHEGALRAGWGPAKVALLESRIQSYLVLPFTIDVCRRWAEVRAGRRAQPIASDDAWIAATELAYSVPLVTHNPSDFGGIAALKVLTVPVP